MLKQELSIPEPLLAEQVLCSRVVDDLSLDKVHQLLEPEFLSIGGNIRDISYEELCVFARDRGEIWAAFANGEAVACLSLLPIAGEKAMWTYVNHGVSHPSIRGRRLGIQDQLLQKAMADSSAGPFLVLTVAKTIFTQAGFREVTLPELAGIDPGIGAVVGGKLRPHPPHPHICIKLPEGLIDQCL